MLFSFNYDGKPLKKEAYRINIDDIIHQPKHSGKLYIKPQYTHLRVNKKKELMQEGNKKSEKFTEIERENRILVEKIHRIMRSNKHSYVPNGLSINIQNNKFLKSTSKGKLKVANKLNSHKSSEAYSAITTPKPNIEYPKSLSHSTQPRSKKRFALGNQRRLSPLKVDIKKLVFKQTIFFYDSSYLVEVFKGKDLIRIVACTEKYDKQYSVEVSFADAIDFMKGTENWELLIKCLHLENNEMSLFQEE